MSTITVDESIFNALSAPADALNIVGLNTLMEECIYMLPGCSELMLRKTLQQTFRKFCEITGTYLCVDSGTVTHESIALPLCKDDGEFFIFLGASLDDVDCDMSTVTLRKECGSVYVDFSLPADEDDENGDPVEYDAKAIYSIIPKIGTELAPLWFLNKYGSTLVAGTLFRLLAMPNKPWSDSETAKLQALDFQNGLNAATIERLTGGNHSDLNCRAPTTFV